jgi:hypothetical protein
MKPVAPVSAISIDLIPSIEQHAASKSGTMLDVRLGVTILA